MHKTPNPATMHPQLQAVLDREALAEELLTKIYSTTRLPLETIQLVESRTMGVDGFKRFLLIINEMGDILDPRTWYQFYSTLPPSD